ncbi:hypothetical protein BGX28_001151 [Mortierella sp. GBA30]|nr:hypothetical protein BGX28_001151 [Mortierella sp. GBA30]
MLPINHSPPAARVGGSLSNNSFRPLPNPAEEAQMIRQRSQAQLHPPTGVSFSLPLPTSSQPPVSQMPDSHYPFGTGYGPHSSMSPPASSPYLQRNNGSNTLHYGPAPLRQARRYKTTKKVTLTQGNLVLDCPVPTKLLDVLPRKTEEEFTSMRYTAVTCDPNDFPHHNYTLRPKMLNRQTELFIVMTMYNVSAHLFSGNHFF